jgi:hypothetical protein
MTIILKSLILVLGIFSFVIAGDKREFTSPDKLTRAIIYNFSDKDVVQESRIRILNHKGKILFDTSFASKDRQHGLCVVQAQWTTDSQFFVFGMSSSGGHQPWHFFTYTFSRTTNRLISVDKAAGPITSRFTLMPPDSFIARSFTTNINQETTLTLRLSNLIQKK